MLWISFILIAFGCMVAVYNWRWGILAAVIVGLVQDPLRKMIPETPGFMAMASVPVWLAVFAATFFQGQLRIHPFLNRFPRLGKRIIWFAGYLVIPALISATYGPGSWQITILGLMIYSCALLALIAGWQYPRDVSMRVWLLSFYALAASAMLAGGPLEYMGWGTSSAAIGTETLGHVWVTHRTGAAVYMMAGFFRGPDVMGWHASLVFMIGIIMAMRSRGSQRLFWIGIAVWGILNIWLCGRRKMLSMVPVFLGCYMFLLFKYRDARRFLPGVGLIVMTLGMGWYVISSVFYTEEVEQFYLTTIYEADDQIRRHGYDAVIDTIKQAGFFGYGLGMGQQGTHHLKVAKPRMWQESGPTKIVAELGVPGSLLFLILIITLGITAIQVVRYSARDETFPLSAGIFSILAANTTSAIVSAQIYGDPFVALLLSILTGMLLANVRFLDTERGST